MLGNVLSVIYGAAAAVVVGTLLGIAAGRVLYPHDRKRRTLVIEAVTMLVAVVYLVAIYPRVAGV